MKSPPDNNGIPTLPPPQTVSGTLEQEGDCIPRKITGMFKDTPMALATWRYITYFSIDDTMVPTTNLYSFKPMNPVTSFRRDNQILHWQDLALLTGKYWNGRIVYRFWMPTKPDKVIGRVIFRYRPERIGSQPDSLYRESCVEWDLSLSDFIDLEFTPYNTIEGNPVRPILYKPQMPTNATGQNAGYQVFQTQLPAEQIQCGHVDVEVSSRLQPTTLYPSQYNIYVEQCFLDASTSVITDFRCTTADELVFNSQCTDLYPLQQYHTPG